MINNLIKKLYYGYSKLTGAPMKGVYLARDQYGMRYAGASKNIFNRLKKHKHIKPYHQVNIEPMPFSSWSDILKRENEIIKTFKPRRNKRSYTRGI